MRLLLAVAFLLSCASTPAATPSRECWVMRGSGEIGEVEGGYLCVRLRESRCWHCTEIPDTVPEGDGA